MSNQLPSQAYRIQEPSPLARRIAEAVVRAYPYALNGCDVDAVAVIVDRELELDALENQSPTGA